MPQEINWVTLSGFKKIRAISVVLLASFFFFYEFIQMNMLGSLAQGLQNTFSLSALDLGFLGAAYFFSDFICLYPVGSLLDRLSARHVILFGMALCMMSVLLISFAHHLTELLIARLLGGCAAAFCFLSILRLATGWFPAEKMGSVTGGVVTLGMLGGAFSQAPLVWLMGDESWRLALRDLAILGGGLFVLMFLFVRDAPVSQSFRPKLLSTPSFSLWKNFSILASQSHNWLIGLYIATMNLPVFILAGLFGIQFMSESYHFSHFQASMISMMIFIGTIVGSTLFGILSDAIKNRRLPMLGGAISSLVLFVIILYGPAYHYSTYLVLFFALGLMTATQIIAYPMTQELNSRALSGSAFGFISLLIIGLPMILQPLIGALITGEGVMTHLSHLHLYSLEDYRRGFSLLILGFFISLFCAYSLPESYGVKIEKI